MPTPILVTKLFIPPTRPELVHRPSLIKQLNDGLDGKLSLISAPAGFGKTTLVSEWVDNLRLGASQDSQIENKIAWFSLDASDNDSSRFLTYLIAAMRTIEGDLALGALSALQSPQPPPAESILTILINELAPIPGRFILVLDDYHLIEAGPVHDTLVFVLENQPPNLHLVIATREDPPLHLARLRARGQLTELRATDLRFTTTEAAEFLNQVMGINLSAEDIATLETRTEGWIAGLQLAAISMQRQEDNTNFIKSFTGSHRLVLDYLIEEVLEQQSDNVQAFLLETAILDRLNGSLCDAVTGQENGQATLEMLERANLFVVSLDDDRCWYRYHHLFADLLRQRLNQTQPNQVSTLHRQAGKWYEDHNLVTEALNHIFAARDYEWAVRLVEKIGAETLWKSGDWISLFHWLGKFPKDVVYTRPELCLLSAWSMGVLGNPEPIEPFLKSVEAHLQDDGDNMDTSATRLTETTEATFDGHLMSKDAGSMMAEVATIRAVNASRRGDLTRANELYHHALELMPDDNLFLRARVIAGLAEIHYLRGEVVPASHLYAKAHISSIESGYIHWASSVVSSRLADLQMMQGQLHQAADSYHQMQHVFASQGEQNLSVAGQACVGMGQILYAWNDLDGAVQQLQEGIDLGKRVANPRILLLGYLALSRALQAQGDATGALSAIQEAAKVWQQYHLTRWSLLPPVSTHQAWLSLIQGDIPSAIQWAQEQGLNPDGELNYQFEVDYITLARLLIIQGDVDEAFGLLHRLHEAAEEGGRISRRIEILLLQALSLQTLGDMDQAITMLKEALTLAEPGGFIRIFVDEGTPMARLLHEILSRAEALSRGISPNYVQRLLAAFPIDEPEQAASMKSKVDQSELIEPLSEREIEVLQLIAEGLTSREIATRLYLSPNTVKAHTRNIYGKLGVHSRTQAIARSQGLGLLSRR